jgi:glycosyltransferase involved in cell wall biosynthesis
MSFHLPYVQHFRRRGWRVDGAARGIRDEASVSGAFDAAYELPFSRSITDLRALAAGATDLAAVLSRGYDIVHVHTPIAGFVTRAMIRRLPCRTRPRVVYTAHGFHFHSDGRGLTNLLFIAAERVAGRWTDRLVVINKEDLAAAWRYRLVSRARLRYMPGIGVDTDWYSRANVSLDASRAALRSIGLDADRPYFVSVGELNRNKRPTDLVKALAQMQDREPSLLLLGVGPEHQKVRQLATELGVADRVVVPGKYVADIRPLVAPAIALVQASKREGLPRSIMEALSLEVPVITSAARGSRELVDGDRGQVVPIGAPAEMARAMDRLHRDPATRVEMGRHGRRLMVDRFSLRRMIEEHERLYRELLAESREHDCGS